MPSYPKPVLQTVMKPTAKKRSATQEKRLAKVNGGVVQPGSGNGDHRKSDVSTPKYLIEAKCRAGPEAKSITVQLADLITNENHGLVSGKMAVLAIELGGRDWYILSNMVWAELS